MTQGRFSAAGLGSRVITGLILAAVLIVCWAIGGWFLYGLLTVVTVVGLWEFYSMTLPKTEAPGTPPQNSQSTLICGCGLGFGYITVSWLFPTYPPHLSLVVVAMLVALLVLFRWNKESGLLRLARAAVLLGGIAYIPLLLAPALHYSPMEQLMIVAVPALSDVAAYFAGVSIGRHKIWPAVSPKKSMEGAVAGLAAAMLVCCVIGGIYGTASLGAFALLGLALGVMSQLGDFFESAVKRTVDVKDSSHILPGHGGVLDRIDSILFACATYAVLSGWMPFFA